MKITNEFREVFLCTPSKSAPISNHRIQVLYNQSSVKSYSTSRAHKKPMWKRVLLFVFFFIPLISLLIKGLKRWFKDVFHIKRTKKEETKTTTKSTESPITTTSSKINYDELVKNSLNFQKAYPMPTKANQISTVGKDLSKRKEIETFASETRPIMHKRMHEMLSAFISYKQDQGSNAEKALYKEMTPSKLVDRLILKRPVYFYNKTDDFGLQNGKKGSGGFQNVGTCHQVEPLYLEDTMSYDEMKLSAFLFMSTPTFFINSGSRNNRGAPGKKGTFQEKGVYIGGIGPRLEKEGVMAWEHMYISKKQNTKANGYGSQADKSSAKYKDLAFWSKIYSVPGGNFPSYEEVKADYDPKKYLLIDKGGADPEYINLDVYRQRIKIISETICAEANKRGKDASKQVYLPFVGLGLGYWLEFPGATEAHKAAIRKIYYEEVLNTFKSGKYSQISDVVFRDANERSDQISCQGQMVKVHYNLKDPASKLEDQSKLLVATYAWDGNSFPGNEFWVNATSASGDPAAACCSMIAELQNPLINTHVRSKYLLVH